ncbi:MAG: flagellar hook protein FlgE [Deltaproteobacteria bacterium]|nr:flagellar hook protein FlgE [Deltaproteobacteria bacterium]
MSITSSFYSGLSGLDTHGTAMKVIGDNIANVKTTGFKSSTAHFEDVLGVSLTGVGGGSQTGAGASISTVDGNFIQGSLETTNVATDIAINGKGFFIVQDASSAETFYTRAGHFIIDNQGFYVNAQGYQVQGYLYDSAGTSLVETLADVQINQNSMIPPRVTSTVDMVLNLDASDSVPTYSGSAWAASTAYTAGTRVYPPTPNGYSYECTVAGTSGAAGPTWPTTIGATVVDGTVTWTVRQGPSDISNFSTMVNVFDTLGQSHPVLIAFRKTAANTWAWHALIDGGEVIGGTAGRYQQIGTDTLTFNTSGALTSPTPDDLNTSAINFTNGSTIAANAIDVDFTGTTQYGAASAIQTLAQDGYTAGTVSGVGIDDEGNIVANYTNGTRRKIARLALADFPNLNGLARKGSTLYQATTTSGDPLYNKPGVGGMGNISSSMLEESNVDLASEFIKMIIIQRGYQANTKVITTTDEMLAQLINIR